ncbi:hypothetical protein ElyMa_001380200 [Elysia marginata]|uniref:Uncharacterized protein n=1 Tax=Elysia marginata TaxID=1093978 RepID=A0AAV4IW99_9GAST|nr:hypothetical protein ElyMa_001380200 [Elysia marginata]
MKDFSWFHMTRIAYGRLGRITCGRLERITCGRLKCITCGRLERITCGRLKRITCGRLGCITCGRLERITCGRLERITCERLERIMRGRLERITCGGLERITCGRLRTGSRPLVDEERLNPAMLTEDETENNGVEKRRYMGICSRRQHNQIRHFPCLRSGDVNSVNPPDTKPFAGIVVPTCSIGCSPYLRDEIRLLLSVLCLFEQIVYFFA